MRRYIVGFAALALAATASSGSLQAQDTHGQSGASNSRSFVNDMAVAGMAEVELGRLAADRAASADVKSFGQMMVTDHTKANDELKQVAAQLNIQPPAQVDQKHRDLANRLSKMKGTEFDREYMTAMVQGHQEVLSKLRERAGSQTPSAAGGASGEQALTQWAAKTAPAVQQHLDRAKDVQQKVAK